MRQGSSPWVNNPGASNPLEQRARMPVLACGLPSTPSQGSRVQPGSGEASLLVLKCCGS